MSLLKDNCPRCGASHVTFDVEAQISKGIHRDWIERFEVFAVCRHCHAASIMVVDNKTYDARSAWQDKKLGVVNYSGYINDHFDVVGYVNMKDNNIQKAPKHTPEDIAAIFTEGSTCISLGCWNAAGAMFRLAVDMTTKSLLPPQDQEPNAKIRRSLGLRLDWMFQNGVLPKELEHLADCIKEDGNDGAHDGTLGRNDALDLQDFTDSLLDRLFTTPKRIELASERRRARRERT